MNLFKKFFDLILNLILFSNINIINKKKIKKMEIYIYSLFFNFIKDKNEKNCYLIGFKKNTIINILSSIQILKQENLENNFKKFYQENEKDIIRNIIPFGIQIIGFFLFQQNELKEDQQKLWIEREIYSYLSHLTIKNNKKLIIIIKNKDFLLKIYQIEIIPQNNFYKINFLKENLEMKILNNLNNIFFQSYYLLFCQFNYNFQFIEEGNIYKNYFIYFFR